MTNMMNMQNRKALILVPVAVLVAVAAMTLGACAPYYSEAEVLIYERATRPDRQPQGGGGDGGGGGGGGGGH